MVLSPVPVASAELRPPYFSVNLNDFENVLIFDVMSFFKDNDVKVLNVAGNRGTNQKESISIYKLTCTLLKKYIETYHKHY